MKNSIPKPSRDTQTAAKLHATDKFLTESGKWGVVDISDVLDALPDWDVSDDEPTREYKRLDLGLEE